LKIKRRFRDSIETVAGLVPANILLPFLFAAGGRGGGPQVLTGAGLMAESRCQSHAKS